MIQKTPNGYDSLPIDGAPDAGTKRTAEEIQEWIVTFLAQDLQRNADSIDVTVPLDHQCVDSVAAVGMTGRLEEWLGKRIDPTVIFDYPTIEELAKHLAGDAES